MFGYVENLENFMVFNAFGEFKVTTDQGRRNGFESGEANNLGGLKKF